MKRKTSATMEEICLYFSNTVSSIRNLTRFCKTAFLFERQGTNIDIKLKTIFVPLSKNGLLVVKGDNKFVMRINLFPLIADRRCSHATRFFRLYTTILHEFEHAKMLAELKDTYPTGFQEAMAMLELLPGVRRLNNLYTYEGLFSRETHKQTQDRYFASSSEQISICRSYELAYQRVGHYLSEDERKKLELILGELPVLKNHLEICYLSRMAPASKFMHLLRICFEAHKKGKLSFSDYPVLSCFFVGDSDVRSAIDLYHEAFRESRFDGVVAQTLLRLFIFKGPDFAELFEKESAALPFLEKLANEYIAGSVAFIKSANSLVLFRDSNILSDNIAMIMHNIRLLNERMAEFNMVQQQGTIYPLYKYIS